MAEFINAISNKTLLPILLLAIVSLCVIAVLARRSRREEKLRERITWSVCQHPLSKQLNPFDNKLLNEIWDVQRENAVPKEYCITKNDEIYADVILLECQHQLLYKFFRHDADFLSFRTKRPDEGRLLFFRELYHMLKKNECESSFCKEEMDGEYISSDGDYSSAYHARTYMLSPFGMVYFKLYYLSYLYLKTNPDGEEAVVHVNPEEFTDILNEKRRTVERIR